MVKKNSFLESIVMVAIVLVLIQTFLEDWAVISGWSWDVRRVMVFTGLAFDLFFTVEFLVRLYFSIYRGRAREYFFYEKGWIDFLAAIPLLVLNSGPSALAVLAGGAAGFSLGGSMNILKVVKAIRIARILRLLRMLKIFKQLKNAESVMAQRHVAKISTLAVSVLVLGLFLVNLLAGPMGLPSHEDLFTAEKETVLRNMPAGADTDLLALRDYASREKSVLIIRHRGEAVYTRYDNHYYHQWYGPWDYDYTTLDGWEVFFDRSTAAAVTARQNIMFFIIIIFVVLAFMIFYSPHFALTISDPIHVMRRGFNEQSYNLEVRIPERFKNDDVYRLAANYNEVYLPLKDRNREEENSAGALDLKIEDMGALFEE